MYETMLIEQIISAIQNLFLNYFDRMVPARAPVHFGLRVLLDETFSNR